MPNSASAIQIEIEHCNNIQNGNISLYENELNIKFAPNGTGKSTIANILTIKDSEGLLKFKPFGAEEIPSVTQSKSFQSVCTFNEDFVNNMVFERDSVIKDAFNVFIKTEKYTILFDKLETHLAGLHTDLKNDEEIQEMSEKFSSVMKKLSLNANKTPKNSPFFKSLKRVTNQYNIPESLQKFKPFIGNDSYNVSWVDWKDKGFQYDDQSICPFCAISLSSEYQHERETFKDSYKKADIQNVKDMSNIVEALKEFLNEEKYEDLIRLIANPSDQKALEQVISGFVSSVEYLNMRVQDVVGFSNNKINKDEISGLSVILEKLIINPDYALEYFNSEKTKKVIALINQHVQRLIAEVTDLKIEIGALKGFINATEKSYSEDINEFLELAGFNYEVSITTKDDDSAETKLLYKRSDTESVEVSNIRDHLSWGERNALALVLFMFHALSKNADLVILDDPISSFDNYKKYPIIHRLFTSRKADRSFAKKTVLLLTHDSEPLIDFLIVGKPYDTGINAAFLKNKNGTLTECEITKSDFILSVHFYRNLAKSSEIPFLVRISALRKYIEYTEEDTGNNNCYNLLSSLIHGKPFPDRKVDFENYIILSKEEIASGELVISRYIPNFLYSTAIIELTDKEKFFRSYEAEERSYCKLVLLRGYIDVFKCREAIQEKAFLKMIDESYHIENDYSYCLNYFEFDIVPFCTQKKADSYIASQKALFFNSEENVE